MDALEQCPGCGAAPGRTHEEDCDHAACPECGEQLLMHECQVSAGGVVRPASWHGLDQRAEVAQAMGWWTTAAGIDHLVEDYTRVLFAIALRQVTWDREAQRYVIGQVDEAVLDRQIHGS